jgi:hypothetical protein
MDFQAIWAEHSTTIIIGVVGAVLLFVAYKLLATKQKVIGEDMTLNVRCTCGWQGTVTKYNQVCRKCNGTDLKRF